MSVNFFGQFLIDKKIISKLELLRAIELQEKSNLRFGDLVINLGLMTAEQKSLVLEAQRHEDLPFGEMAAKLGILSPKQIEKVLTKQRQQHLFIGEALVNFKLISQEDLDRYLIEFNGKKVTVEKITIPEGIIHKSLWVIVFDITCKMLTRVASTTFHSGFCTITKSIPLHQVVIEAEISGSIKAKLLLTTSADTINMLTNAILKRPKEAQSTAQEIEETIIKFINITAGNIVSKATQIKQKINISQVQIKQATQDKPLPEIHQTGLQLPIYFSNGENLELTILIPQEGLYQYGQ